MTEPHGDPLARLNAARAAWAEASRRFGAGSPQAKTAKAEHDAAEAESLKPRHAGNGATNIPGDGGDPDPTGNGPDAGGGPGFVPIGGDDEVDEEEAKARAAAEAAKRRAANHAAGFRDEPLPLFPPGEAAAAYPVDALGVLGPAAEAIAVHIQVPVVMAAQSVLATGSHAVQALRDVRLPYGQSRPASTYHVTVADSGDRKTSGDKEASAGTRQRERELRDEHDDAKPGHMAALAAYEAKKKHITSNKNLSQDAIREAIAALVQPKPLLLGTLVQTDITLEGLARAWPTLPASQALFTSEGGVVLDGAAMSKDLRTRSAGNLSQLWDNEPMSRLRGTSESTITVGKRLAIHAIVQPKLAAAFLGDDDLRNQGILSRLLVAAPGSIAGSRLFRRSGFATLAAIKAFADLTHGLLARPWQVIGDNELHPDALLIPEHGAAEAAWIAYHDEVEIGVRRGSLYARLKDVAAKSAEQAARLAAILTVYADPAAGQVTLEAMRNGIVLARWYLREALRLQQAGVMSMELAQATMLLEWLQANPDVRNTMNVMRLGPYALRLKPVLDPVMKILIDHGWVKWLRGSRNFAVWQNPEGD